MFLLFICILSSFLLHTKGTDFDNLEVVSDLLPEDCFTAGQDYRDADTTDGLPKCVKFTKPSSCSMYNNPKSPIYGYDRTVNKPTCLKDLTFAPKQCKGERITGRCFCFDKDGKRIFGQNWWKQADDTTCACSRKKAEMRAEANSLYFNSLHCNSLGNYEPLQCDVVSEQCWCAEEKTGDLKSPVVPASAMAKLPCYTSISVGDQYLRQCESKLYAQARILYEFSLHGTVGSSFGQLVCDEDGAYGPYKIVDGSAYCTWRDNTNLGSFQYSGTDYSSELDCNCARDQRIFKNAGKTQNLDCTGTGNYKPLQKLGGTPYCVDSDGFRTTRSTDAPTRDEDCNSYPSYNKK